MKLKHKAEIITLSGLILAILGEPSALLNVLIAVIAIDYCTGLARAGYERRMNSNVGAKGIIKKISYMLAVALAHQVDLWLGTGDKLRSLSVSLFISNEVWSNIENLAVMGIVFPRALTEKLKEIISIEQLNKKGGDQDADLP